MSAGLSREEAGPAAARHYALLKEALPGAPWHRVAEIVVDGFKAVAAERPRDRGARGMYHAAVLNLLEVEAEDLEQLIRLRNAVLGIAHFEDLRGEDLLSGDWEAVAAATMLYPTDRARALEALADLVRQERMPGTDPRKEPSMTTTRYDAAVERLRELKSGDAPWYALAQAFFEGEELAQQESLAQFGLRGRKPLADYRARSAEATGLSNNDLQRMGVTLSRMQFLWLWPDRPEVMSDDFAAVEAAVRLAWIDRDTGIKALEDLKSGRTTREAVMAMRPSSAITADPITVPYSEIVRGLRPGRRGAAPVAERQTADEAGPEAAAPGGP